MVDAVQPHFDETLQVALMHQGHVFIIVVVLLRKARSTEQYSLRFAPPEQPLTLPETVQSKMGASETIQTKLLLLETIQSLLCGAKSGGPGRQFNLKHTIRRQFNLDCCCCGNSI